MGEPVADPFPATRPSASARNLTKSDLAFVGSNLLSGKYKIVQAIGAGGMGTVYLAVQEPFDRKVAVKVLPAGHEDCQPAVDRFEQEARAISKLSHPNTVTVFDVGHTDDARPFLVMEYLRGRTLREVLDAERTIDPLRACRIARQLCGSLADAHAANIIHRDLKPENLMLTEVGTEKDWLKVLDFGLAKLLDSEKSLTATGRIFGTPRYMAPEQAEGKPADHRSDIYSIGIIFYEMLMGRPPFDQENIAQTLVSHLRDPPPNFSARNPEVRIPSQLEAIVMRALAKKPVDRYASTVELGEAIAAFEKADGAPASLIFVSPPPALVMPVPVAHQPSQPLIELRRKQVRLAMMIGAPIVVAGLTAVIALALSVLFDPRPRLPPPPVPSAVPEVAATKAAAPIPAEPVAADPTPPPIDGPEPALRAPAKVLVIKRHHAKPHPARAPEPGKEELNDLMHY